MTPPNFSVQPRSPRRFLAPIVVAVLALAGIGVYIGSRGGSSGNKPTVKQSTAAVGFVFRESAWKPVYEGVRPPAATQNAERQAVHNVFILLYRGTFLTPSNWKKDPTFTSMAKYFTPEARTAFTRDVASMSVAEGVSDFKTVTPTLGRAGVSIYFDKTGKAAWAAVVIKFQATARTTKGQTVLISQDATYRLQKTPNAWLIFSYAANEKQDTPGSPSASPSGSPS